MALFQCILFSNTDSKVRLGDVMYTEDLRNMGNINWCKAVVDNLSKAARLYRKDFASKGVDAPMSGCGIFLTVSLMCIGFCNNLFFSCFIHCKVAAGSWLQ